MSQLITTAISLCNDGPDNKEVGWDWDTIPAPEKLHWIEAAHHQLIHEAKEQTWDEGQDSVTLQHDIYGANLEFEDNPHRRQP